LSHEFRTPLAAQLASIELLREGLHTMHAAAAGGTGAVA
jgi:signal transduction histidine kinase